MITQENEQFISDKPRCVVGIGASAGGLEALQQLLSHLPGDTGMAFVIIQHLSPNHVSLMPDILGKYTEMPVAQAEDRTPVRENCVYLISPGYDISISEGGTMHLDSYDRGTLNHPVDIFLRSLAEAYKKNAVAVILSGTGSDGTNGIRAIKESGGIILAQTPESSKFDGMPRSAISTGFADFILSAEGIGLELAHIAKSLPGVAVSEAQTDEEPIRKVFSILKDATGINYARYKKATALRCIERRMVVLHKTNLQDYVDYLSENRDESRRLGKAMLVGVTSFFRDAAYFDVLKEKVIIPLLKNSGPDTQIRVWTAGCSTGEEAYTISILFVEAMEELKLHRRVKIFATDIDQEAISFASKGVYGENIMDDVSLSRLSRFFTKKGNKYCVNQEIRRPIIFARHNVFQDPPFGKLDLISCRNMMIYYQSAVQSELFGIFHLALNGGGYLFLGSSEAASGFENVFQSYCSNERIFVHHASGRLPSERKKAGIYNIPQPSAGQRSEDEQFNQDYEGDDEFDGADSYETSQLYLKDLEQIMPPTLLVNSKNELCHTFGDCTAFLTIPTGTATFDIFSLLQEDFRMPVSTALKTVRLEGKRVCYDKVPIKLKDRTANFTVVATPMLDNRRRVTGRAAITLTESTSCLPGDAVPFEIDKISAQHIADLEKELQETQTNLRETTGDLEIANANLQASNEELLTANEELLSSNEELQSVNEELYTVNAQYQDKVNQLATVNNDVLKFLSSTLVGIMFVDAQLSIRNFTNFIAEEFCLAEQDIGRSLRYLASNFSRVDLVKKCEEAIATGEAIDIEAAATGSKYYFIRIAPFEEESGMEKSLILTFVDTTKQYSDQRQIIEIQNELRQEVARGEEKSSFLSRVSHDMRTPMNTIFGLLELSLTERDLSDTVRDNLEKMLDSCRYLISVIDDVLDTSRIRNGKLAPNYSAVAESDILHSLLPMLRKSAEDRGVEFRYHMFGCRNVRVMADVARVKRIVANLVSNAVKFTPPGGCISLSVNTVYSDKRAFYTYFVSDTGIGISEEFQQRMFEPFEQAGNDKTSEMKGTGLGLFICKQFVELMGGTIRCESKPGEGSTFVVKLAFDLADEAEPESAKTRERSYDPQALQNMRVLLCEDHAVNAVICQKLLQKRGILCETAENGRVGLELFENSDSGYYDAILMDMRMPVMGGIEATRAIRALERRDAKSVPIIAVSADAQDEQKKNGYAAGITDYLTKPIEAEKLYAALARH